MKPARTITKIIHGSRLFGTDTPTSDHDFKSVYLPSGRDLLLGHATNVKQTDTKADKTQKNQAGDIDDSAYSLLKFMKLLVDGDTSAIEILLAPRKFRLETSDEFELLYTNRESLLNKKSKGMVGYCRSQSVKYSAKGTRLITAKLTVEFLKKLSQNYTKCIAPRGYHFDKEIEEFVSKTEHASIETLTMSNKVDIKHLVVCGKMFPFTNTLSSGIAMFKPMVDEYGERARQAADNKGVDWKAVSHAIRVGEEAVELMQTGDLTFPRPNAQYLLEVKQGKHPFESVSEYLDQTLVEVEKAAETSALPEQSDLELTANLIIDFHRKQTND